MQHPSTSSGVQSSAEIPLVAHQCLPSTLTDRIPGELHDRIIDHLHSDPSVLLTCSLVSRAWLRASRHHLIPTLEIRRQNAPMLRKLLGAPYATLDASVRRLSLRAGKAVSPDRFLGSEILLLPAVQSLLLSASYLVPVGKLLSWTRCYAHRLVEFVLYHIKIDSLSEFVEGLNDFKVLRHLAMVGVVWGNSYLPTVVEGSDTADTDTALLPSLRSLVLTGQAAGLVWWLLARDIASIARLDLRLKTGRHVNLEASQVPLDIGRYYRALGSSLQELDLYDPRGDHSKIDLSTNNNLRELWFHDVVLSLGGWVLDALAQVTSPHLHTITLFIFSDDHGQRVKLDMFNWRAFTELLSNTPISPSLKTIRIIWLGYYNFVEFVAAEVLKRLAGQVPGVELVIIPDFIGANETTFGATTHGRLFDRRNSVL
ncbi:hypothetical protein D9615_001978 [Tricholomella constricta]|uniref:F-box domain-containing protein n=1 Tax=Tricholomella constricta TaxID=117010 RepID=A0A8H5HNK6_9AGAR|nr:hypothetical protein D9615_001978 [Tricholomella constricta]